MVSHVIRDTNMKPHVYHLIRSGNSNVKSSSFTGSDMHRSIKYDRIRQANLVKANTLVRKRSFFIPGGSDLSVT